MVLKFLFLQFQRHEYVNLMETFCLKVAKGAVFITSIYIVAVNIWRYFTKDKVEAGNEVSYQLLIGNLTRS